jgi:DNA-binding response OmpR family regulator
VLPKILIVDDSKTIRMQVRDLLPKGNFEVSEAKDGVEGYTLISQERPNLVLLDFFMPQMNGWEVLQRLKAQPDLQTIPVVVMTGRREEVLERVPDLFDYYACIEKPFEQRTLMEAVKAALAKAKSRQARTETPTVPSSTQAPSAPTPPAAVETDRNLATQMQALEAKVKSLTETNATLQSEIDLLKKQMAQVVAILRQRL